MDDDEQLAALLCRALRGFGLDPDVAFDGVTAIRRLSNEPFAATLLDVCLPGVSGLEVCRRLRASGSTIPVIMLSARDSIEDVAAGREAGASDYLLKPFSLADLAQRLDDLLGTSSHPHGHLIDAI